MNLDMNEDTSVPICNGNVDGDKVGLPLWLKFSLLFVVVAVISILVLYRWQFTGTWGNQETFAQFGDFIGGTINPILGFATIGLLVWSINIQLRELKATRKEAHDSRVAFQEQLAIARTETSLKQMQMALDYFVTERDRQLERKISPQLIKKIAKNLYSLIKKENSSFSYIQDPEPVIAELVKGFEKVDYRLILENFENFESYGEHFGSLDQSTIRKTIVNTLLVEKEFDVILQTYVYFSLRIVGILFDYNGLTSYKAYSTMTLWKELSERLEPLKLIFDNYNVDPIIPEHYEALVKRIREIRELDIFND